MNFYDYCKNHSGRGVTVTMIDTGIALDEENIIHYRYENGEIIDCNAAEYVNKHGTICAEKILNVAPNVNIIDICVEESGVITESALICALNFAQNNFESDIICICLALDEYSSKLSEILKKYEMTFILASGRKGEMAYPADLSNVIKVYYDSEANGVEIIANDTIAVNCEGIQSSSSACAYTSGLFSILLEAKAIWQFEDIRKLIFADVEKSVVANREFVLPEKFIAVFPYKFLEYKNDFIENLVGYYDTNMVVRNYDGSQFTENYKTICINEEERKKVIAPSTIGDYFVGNFINYKPDNTLRLRSHYAIEGDYICDISQPIIAIASFGYGASKFDLQLKCYSNISKLGYSVKCTTYNPLGILFNNFDVFEYPEQIVCPKLIYSVNKYVYETAITSDPDIFLLNIAGSIRDINYHNSYDMGMLFEVYKKAFRIDIVLLCVNINVDIDVILLEIEKLKTIGISEVVLVVSENQYDYSSYKTAKGMRYFECDRTKQEEYAKALRSKYTPDLIYMLDDFDVIDINEAIIKKFS